MRLNKALFILIAFVYVITGCSYKVIKGDFINRPLINEIKESIQGISGLRFKSDVEIEILDKKDLKGYLKRFLMEGLSEDYLTHLQVSFQLIGLLPDGFHLEEGLLRFYEDQVLGFYNHRDGKLYLVRGAKKAGIIFELMQTLLQRDIVGEFILSHELFHALQHQYFPMDEFHSKHPQMDRLLAAEAVVEGSAMIVSMNHTLGLLKAKGMGKGIVSLLQEYASSMEAPEDIPRPLYHILLFPYLEGLIFIDSIIEKEGWKGVYRVLQKPPLTTSEIIHHKYGEIRPAFISPEDYSNMIPQDGWIDVWQNTFGEFIIYELLRNYMSDDEARKGADGWRGDIIKLFKKEDRWLALWVSNWDKEKDAEEFFHSLKKIVEKRFPQGEIEGYLKGRRIWWRIGDRYTFIEKKGALCFVGIGYPSIPENLTLFGR